MGTAGLANHVLQRTAAEQTKAVFEPLRQRLTDAATKLEEQIPLSADFGATEEQLDKAKEILEQAKTRQNAA